MANRLFILGNGVDWCEKSLQGIKEHENIYLLNKKIPVEGNIKNKLAKLYFSYKINSKIQLPFKSFWYKDIKKYIKKNINDGDELCVLIYDHITFGGEVSFSKYLRKEFKNIKLVYIFTNIVNYTAAMEKKYLDKLNDWYDVVYAFDLEDSKKYNFKYFPLIYSYNHIDVKEKNQVFYVGKAKDRYNMLMNCYDKLEELGINRKFYIVDVPEENQKHKDEIQYNKFLTYNEFLKNIQESSCLIDIIQGESTGFTIKTCEAVYYDKLLITTNQNVKNAPFYDERYILVINSAEDITKEFFEKAGQVKYSDEGKAYFSVDTFLNKLYKDLSI